MHKFYPKLDDKQIRQIRMSLEKILFERHEEGTLHNSSFWNVDVYQIIASGDVNVLRETMKDGITIPGTLGALSQDELRSLKNQSMLWISTIVEPLIQELYLDKEIACSIADASILTIDECRDVQSVLDAVAACMFVLTEQVAHANSKYHPLVKNTKDYIHKHFHEKIRVEEIAKKLGTSSSYLAQVFRQSEGMTIHDYIRREKISRAKNMILYSDLSLQTIAEYLGYVSSSHFAREFRAESGESPSAFRSRVKEFSRDTL